MGFVKYNGELVSGEPVFRIRKNGAGYFGSAYVVYHRLQPRKYVDVYMDVEQRRMKLVFQAKPDTGRLRVASARSSKGLTISLCNVFAFFRFRPAPGVYDARKQPDGSVVVQFTDETVESYRQHSLARDLKQYQLNDRHRAPQRGPKRVVYEALYDFLGVQDHPVPFDRLLVCMGKETRLAGLKNLDKAMDAVLRKYPAFRHDSRGWVLTDGVDSSEEHE